MDYTEYLGWLEYFDQVPIGWRDDLRFFKVMRTIGTKGEPGQMFESLAKIGRNREQLPDGELSVKSLRGSVMFSRMLGAKGGDDLSGILSQV